MNSWQAIAFSITPAPNLQRAPFHCRQRALPLNPGYCCSNVLLYWGIHTKRDLSYCAKLLAPKQFGDCENRISTGILSQVSKPSVICIDFDKLALFNGLHCASIFEIGRIVVCLVEVESCSINQKDSMGATPLAWAAGNGHEAVVELLLGRADINPDKPGGDGRTPLVLAACGGHQGVVEMLLGRDDVNPNKLDGSGETPLGWAAYKGREGVVKILLGRDDIDPMRPGEDGVTPLGWAAYEGHKGVVEILLGRDDVSPDCLDNRGQTPLSLAAESGHVEVVQILLERKDVDPYKPDKAGQRPLCYAAENGHGDVVEMLLKPDGSNVTCGDRCPECATLGERWGV